MNVDRVRAIQRWLWGYGPDCSCGSPPNPPCAECAPIKELSEVCDFWIKAHTARWALGDLSKYADELRVGTQGLGSIVCYEGTWLARFTPTGATTANHPAAPLTREEARAWLEEQAKVAGYEVSK